MSITIAPNTVITQAFIQGKNRPWLRDPDKYIIENCKGIILHDTANLRASARANRRWFEKGERWGSTQFIIDAKEILQLMEINEVAYHVGDSVRDGVPTPMAIPGHTRSKANYYYIGIEMCVNRNNYEDWIEVIRKTILTIRYLLRELPHLSYDDVGRHIDVTGKPCPMMFKPIFANTPSGKGYFEWNWHLFQYMMRNSFLTIEPEEKTEPIITPIPPNPSLTWFQRLLKAGRL